MTEVNFTGKKLKTKVFAGGAVIAEQQSQLALDGSDDPKVVVWIHADPVTGSPQYVNKDGSNWYRKEYEPLGGQEVLMAARKSFPSSRICGEGPNLVLT
jgi:hypothetical protein